MIVLTYALVMLCGAVPWPWSRVVPNLAVGCRDRQEPPRARNWFGPLGAGLPRARCSGTMLRSTLLLSLMLTTSLLAGCKKDQDKTKATGGEGAAKVEPFKGELTEDVLSNANRAIVAYKNDGQPADFAPTLAAAKTALGEPTHVDGSMHAWGFAAGDKCTYYALVDEGGKAKAPGVMTVDKAAGSMYEKCMKALGKAALYSPAESAEAAVQGEAGPVVIAPRDEHHQRHPSFIERPAPIRKRRAAGCGRPTIPNTTRARELRGMSSSGYLLHWRGVVSTRGRRRRRRRHPVSRSSCHRRHPCIACASTASRRPIRMVRMPRR